MVILAHKHQVLIHGIALVGILSEKSPFLVHDKSEHAFHRHATSDAMARLRCFGAYAYIRESKAPSSIDKLKQFCEEHHLADSILSRAYDLFKQICHISTKVFQLSTQKEKFLPPKEDEEILLQKILLSSFCDQVSMKIPANHAMLNQNNEAMAVSSRRKRFTAYQSCNPNISEPVYIHPKSALYQSDPVLDHPPYLVYSNLVKNDKGDTTYMDCVTAVDPRWFTGGLDSLLEDAPLIKYSDPLSAPTPYYDSSSDQIMCYVIPFYGYYRWEFSAIAKAYTETNQSSSLQAEAIYRWFARFLFEGKILPELRHVLSTSHIKETPTIFTAMKTSTKIATLLWKLKHHSIVNRASLIHSLGLSRASEVFLLEEIQGFLQIDRRKAFRKEWEAFVNKLILQANKPSQNMH
jgi:hypothetical protein